MTVSEKPPSDVAARLEEFSRDLRERTGKINELITRLERVGEALRPRPGSVQGTEDAAEIGRLLSRIEKLAEGLRERDERLAKDIAKEVRRHEKQVDRA